MLVSPYLIEDLERYADTLVIVGGFRGVQKAGIRKNFVQIIAKMPPWQQVILIESKFSNISGDDDTINKLGDQLPGTCDKVLGFYDDQRSKFTLSAREEFETVCGIFWTFDIYGTHDAPTFFHEQGHRLLEILKEECEFDFFNGFFTRRRWEDACAHEVISQGMTRDACEPSLRQPEKLNARSGISLNIEAFMKDIVRSMTIWSTIIGKIFPRSRLQK